MAPLLKCVVLGNTQAGKTSLVRTYIDKTFKCSPPATIYVEYAIQTTTSSGSSSNLILCDSTGVDDYACAKRLCYPNTDIFLICFSVVGPDYSEDIREYYLSDIRMCCPNVPIVLVGTKLDLRDDKEFLQRTKCNPITYEQGMQLAREIGAIEYLECSALKGTGVQAVFDVVATCGLQYRSQYGERKRKKGCSII